MKLLNKVLARTEADHLEFAPPLLRLQESAPNPLGRTVLWAILVLVGGLILWALIGRLDIVAVAEGKLVPQSYVKIVQPSEAGIVKGILVTEGEAVKAGQVLMRMDALITDADATALQAESARKRMALRRIDAELSGVPFLTAAGDPSDLAREIEAQHRANRASLDAALAEERSRLVKAKQDLSAAEEVRNKLTETLPHYREQERAYDKLVKDGFAGHIMGSDKRRERIEKERELKTQLHVIESARASTLQSEKKLAQIDTDYRRQLHVERNETQAAVDKLGQEIAKQAHRRNLLELKAPQDGVVKDLATHTAGTVVQPGTVMLTLVPQDETLRAEVWVSNQDIGFVHPGQKVKLKFAAFSFQKYGMAEGVVLHVGADAADAYAGNAANNAAPASDRSGRAMPLVYKALVTMKSMNLEMNGERFRLGAGMQTSAEILLGTRSVAEYLLSPVQQAWHEAARER
ncbi:MAG: HlyD family type I secretion periplasmic adaptor subunit [Pseudomonadota bacterium]